MSGSILANADRVVSKYIDDWQVRQGCQADAGAAIIREHQEGSSAWAKNIMSCDTVQDRAHAVLPDTEADVASASVTKLKIVGIFRVTYIVKRRTVEIRTAANQQRRDFGQRLKDLVSGFAGRQLAIDRKLGDCCKQRI